MLGEWLQQDKNDPFDAEGDGDRNALLSKKRRKNGKSKHEMNKRTKRYRVHPGPKPNAEFEQAALDELIITAVAECADQEQMEVVCNVCYSYDIVRTILKKVYDSDPKWECDPVVGKLKQPFTQKYIFSFLKRARLQKRRVTTVDEKKPTEEEVNLVMAEIHNRHK